MFITYRNPFHLKLFHYIQYKVEKYMVTHIKYGSRETLYCLRFLAFRRSVPDDKTACNKSIRIRPRYGWIILYD